MNDYIRNDNIGRRLWRELTATFWASIIVIAVSVYAAAGTHMFLHHVDNRRARKREQA